MAQAARAARAQIPKRGLGLGRAIRRIREMHGIGQEVLAERSGLSQGYLSQIESGAFTAVTEEAFGGIATALGVEPWMILAQAPRIKARPGGTVHRRRARVARYLSRPGSRAA